MKDFYILQEGELDDYFNFVCQLPENESPELYGLNQHVYINDANRILGDILSLSENTSTVQGHSGNEVFKVTNEITN